MDKYNKESFDKIAKMEREDLVQNVTTETATFVKEQRETVLGNGKENQEEDRSL